MIPREEIAKSAGAKRVRLRCRLKGLVWLPRHGCVRCEAIDENPQVASGLGTDAFNDRGMHLRSGPISRPTEGKMLRRKRMALNEG